jgi:adenosylcobinamide-GDP ribazoletransferase
MTNPVARHVSLLFDAIRFYSRIPVPALPWEVDPHAVPDFRVLPRVLPFAALLIAVPSALVLAAGSAAGLPPYVAAALGVTAGLLATGAMHEDGLADTVDGFGGGHTVERRLEIMADSRTGAYGVTALVMMLVIRTLVLGEMIGDFGGLAAVLSLLASAILSRVLGLMPLVLLPPARPGGRSASVGKPSFGSMVIAVLGALALSTVLLFFGHYSPLGIGLAVTASIVSVVPVLLLSKRLIGGQTGDVAGATQQVADGVMLVALLVR